MLRSKNSGNAIKLIVCDGDGTLINYRGSPYRSSWDMLGHLYYPKDEWQSIATKYVDAIKQTKNAEEQDRIFEEWANRDARALKGKDIRPARETEIPYNNGVKEFFSTHNREKRAIISGGVDIIIDRVMEELEFDYCYTNLLGIEEGRFNGKVDLYIKLHNKNESLSSLLRRMGTGPENTLAVGDGSNDIPMFEHIRRYGGTALAINPESDAVANAADATIDNFMQINNYLERQ